MHPLDFISEPPTFYIFQKESIKTNLGGFFFFSYIIIMVGICIYYLIDYITDDKFVIQTLIHFNIKSEEEIEKRNENPLYNQNINFYLDLVHSNNDTPISDKFKIVDENKIIGRRVLFNKKINDFKVYTCYECETPNCSDYLDFIKNNTEEYYVLKFVYQGFILKHQNKDPIQKKEDNEDIYFFRYNGFRYNILNYEIIYKWKNIIYHENNFYSKVEDKSCGYIDDFHLYYIPDLITVNINNKSYAIVNNITIQIDYNQYLEYRRTRKSELDLLANILSLFSNIFFGAGLIFKYYASHFNNYKIVEKLLSTENKIINPNYKKKNKSLELENFLNEENNKFMPLNNDSCEIKENIPDNNQNTQIVAERNDDNNGNYNYPDGNSLELKRLHFFDFFLNNLYCDKCCKNINSQNIINLCDKIVFKYASIDNIVYNQILLENLFKDYKWNDPKLNNVVNNNLFNELKNYL